MELQIKINNFFRPLLTIIDGNGNGNGYGYGYGNGNGYGNGDGYGYGYGNGNGNGDGYGNGDGDGDGNGYGYGNGDGISTFNLQKIYIIDKLQTIIKSIKGDVAKGFILQNDLTLKPCFIVRNDYYYVHGETLKEALESLEDKTILKLPIKQRIDNFNNTFKNYDKKYSAQLLYDWHYKLTGSCKMGRDNFCSNHKINLTKTKLTIYEFIDLTKNQYGSEIIMQLKQC